MKFSDVAKGTRAEQASTLTVEGKETAILFRPLSALEEADVTASAIRFAKSKGGEPKVGSDLYETGFMVHALALGVLDPDSPPGARAPFFDGGFEQILSKMDTDSIAQLHERHRMWQEECSPSYARVSVGRLFELSKEFGRDDDDPKVLARYSALSLTTRLTLLRFMAVQLRILQGSKLSPSLSSGTAPENSPSEPQKPTRETSPSANGTS